VWWAFAEALTAQIVHALRGKERLEYDNPYDVGMTGFLRPLSDYYAMESCEVLMIAIPRHRQLPSMSRTAPLMNLFVRRKRTA
jgi:thiamine pyrophosphate-dependent acetolactate synthase large subunit-like protein